MIQPHAFLPIFGKGRNRLEALDEAIATVVDHLGTQHLEVVEDHWEGDFKTMYRRKFRNTWLHRDAEAWRGLTFEAHHDVVNRRSDNLQDNTASLCHLLALATRPDFGGSVAFCDAEELVSYELAGSRRLGEACRGRHVMALEVTGRGSVPWVDRHAPEWVKGRRLTCPVNDAVWMRKAGAAAFCGGCLPRSDCRVSWPREWGYCHSDGDSFGRADHGGMEAYNEWLFGTWQASLSQPTTIRPLVGQVLRHERFGAVEVLGHWGPRSCRVRVLATGKRTTAFDENLYDGGT